MQRGALFIGTAVFNIEFPKPEDEVVPGVLWGSLDAFPSPAYWAYQVFARRIQGSRINYKLGTTLKEEVGACLLGGHGIPASIGLIAFNHVKEKGAFGDEPPSEDSLLVWLNEPISVDGRKVRYRFAKQKAHYLAAALQRLASEQPPLTSGKALRDWLLLSRGIGYKTASWITRNWLDADDVAILDIHILRAGLLGKFFQARLTVERNYLELEDQFLRFSEGLGVRASELDALIWREMMSSRGTVRGVLGKTRTTGRKSEKSSDSSNQLALLGEINPAHKR